MKYRWLAKTADGAIHLQQPHVQTELNSITRLALIDEDDNPALIQHYDREHGPIYTFLKQHPYSGGSGPCHMLGWQKHHDKHLAFLFEDGRLEMGCREVEANLRAYNDLIGKISLDLLRIPERDYTWLAIYQDGTHFTEKDPITGELRSTDWLKRTDLGAFALLDSKRRPIVVQHLLPGQRFVYRRRNLITQHVRTQQRTKVFCHLVGWRSDYAQHVSYVFEGQIIHMAGDFRTSHHWFYPIEETDIDQIVIEAKGLY